MPPQNPLEKLLAPLKAAESAHGVHTLLLAPVGEAADGLVAPGEPTTLAWLFVYPLDAYLAIDPVAEQLQLDLGPHWRVVAWELRAFLRQLGTANPQPAEWAQAATGWHEAPGLREALAQLADLHFGPRPSLHHYSELATQGFARRVRQEATAPVLPVQVLQLLRTVLQGQWVLQRQSPPPGQLAVLLESLDGPPGLWAQARQALQAQLTQKEANEAVWTPEMQDWLHRSIQTLLAAAPNLRTGTRHPKALDACFRRFIPPVSG